MQGVRRRLFAIHGWIGLHLGLWLFLVCFSGAAATLAPEIEWLTQPALRITPAGPLRWQATYDALRRAYPDYVITGIARGEETVLDSQAWLAYSSAPDGRYGVIRVNPYDARIVRPFTVVHFSQFVEQLHYYLYWPPALIGVYIVTSLSVPLLLSLATGVVFQKRWWRSPLRLRVGVQARWSWASAHRVVGLWTLVFGILVGVTGVWYLVEMAFVPFEIAYPDYPSVPKDKLISHGPTPPMFPLDEYVDAARAAFPGLEPNGLDLPFGPGGVIAVKGRADAMLVRDRANMVFLDPFDKSVVAIRRSEESTWLSWWVDVADPLHFGYWGGLPAKLLWCLLGLALPALILSGAYLSFSRARLGRVPPGAGVRGSPRLLSRPIGSWITVAIAIAAAVVCAQAYRNMTARGPAVMEELGTFEVGPWQASLARDPLTDSSESIRYHLRLRAPVGRVASVSGATISAAGATESEEPAEFYGAPSLMAATTFIGGGHEDPGRLLLSVKEWNGAQHITAIDRVSGELRSIPGPEPSGYHAWLLALLIGGFVAVVVGVFWWWLRVAASV